MTLALAAPAKSTKIVAEGENNLMTAEEILNCDKWLAELGILMDKLDAGEITEKDYRKLCFELDKKYNLVDDKDADFYLTSENENLIEAENNFSGQIAVNF